MGFTVKKGSETRVPRRGSEKGVSRRCLERLNPCRVCPLRLRNRKTLETRNPGIGNQKFSKILGVVTTLIPLCRSIHEKW